MDLRPNHQPDPFSPEAAQYDTPNPAIDNIDWSDPTSLFKALNAGSSSSSIPMPEFKSPAEVRKEATAKSQSIFDRYETLRGIIERHESTIQKRWLKKTRQQRLKVLLNAWPNMPTGHRPDFEAFQKESSPGRNQGTNHRASFLWPYINQEDLLNTKTLPLLLNSRGRHPPSYFAGTDNHAIHLGFVTKSIVPIFLNNHVMILNGVVGNTREYGRLLNWDDNPDAFNWMTERRQFLPGEGLIILEAQERILGFLIDCSLELLHDIPASDVTGASFPILAEPSLKTDREINGFESLAVMVAEAPYRVPEKLDLSQIESLLSARTSAAEDHLWALREDPEYFSHVVLEAKDHRQENLKDLAGKAHPVFRTRQQELFWSRILGTVLSNAYLQLEVFSELSTQAKELASLQKKYENQINPSKDLPKDYEDALLRFRFFVKQAAKGPLNILKMTAPASLPLRRFFVREPPLDPSSSKISLVSKPGVNPSKNEHILIWLLSTLWEDGQNLFLASMPVIVDELERLLQSDQHIKELISPYIGSVIGDLSIISQTLNQLELYQPWAQTWELKMAQVEEKYSKEYVQRTQPWAKMLAALSEKNLTTRAAGLGEPSGGKFTYPIHKRRTKDNVEALRQAEHNLDAFWASIDQLMIAKAGDLRNTAVRNLLSQSRILQRTPEWTEPQKATPTAPAPTTGEADRYSMYLPISTIYSGISPRQLDVAPAKQKTKTRGTPHPASSVDADAEAESLHKPNLFDKQPTFKVDARAHKVFRTVFFNPATTSTPGEVSWNDFLHAMTLVGFAATKLYGSVWQFQPTQLDVERSIQFHEPHPRGKVPFTTARRIGRRLNRAYGWFGGMFVLNK